MIFPLRGHDPLRGPVPAVHHQPAGGHQQCGHAENAEGQPSQSLEPGGETFWPGGFGHLILEIRYEEMSQGRGLDGEICQFQQIA